MNDNISEQERKELNKKLLKRTFVSEIKSEKKEKLLKIVIDCVCLFMAFLVTDLIVEKLQIDFWLFDMIISVVFAMIMLFVSEIFVKKLKSKF